MTAAVVVFCCTIALAFVEGFASPAFAGVIASDAFGAAMPFIGFLVVARFAAMRAPGRAALIHRIHAAVQGLLATLSFGWWWVEPHAFLTSVTGGSLAMMAWLAVAGAVLGLAIALLAERASSPTVLRELLLGTWVFVLMGGGRMYRAFDHVEAGTRLAAGAAIVAVTLVITAAVYLLLRRREKLAGAIPALAPALACLALLFAMRTTTGAASLSTHDSVLLVVVDTLRADIADGAFATDRDAMPQLQRIAEQGVRFTQAVSPAPWTLPATVSLLSGWNPHRHGFGASASAWEVLPGDPAAMYLPSAMRDSGYLTAAFVHNPYLRPWFGFGPGFYRMRPYHGRAIDGVALTLDWLRSRMGAPTFTLFHIMDPHWPFDAPPGFGAERQPCQACDSLFATQFQSTTPAVREEVTRRYAAEVRYTDAMLGRFYDTLSAGGALENTWLVITSDHGEELWEHGLFLHGHSLYDELLRVPLVVVPPRALTDVRRGRRVDVQVRLEDVAATILEVAGLDAALAPDGRSLLGLVADRPDAAPRPAVAGYIKSPQDLSWAVRLPPWKATVGEGIAGARLFNLAEDGAEKANLLFDNTILPMKRLVLAQTYKSLVSQARRPGLELDREPVQAGGAVPEADTHRQLRSLGYAQ